MAHKPGIKNFILSSALASALGSALISGGCSSVFRDSGCATATRDAGIHQLHDGEGRLYDGKKSGENKDSGDNKDGERNIYFDGKCHNRKIPPDADSSDRNYEPDAIPDANSGTIPDASFNMISDASASDSPVHDAHTAATPDSGTSDGSTFEQNLSLLEEKLQTLRWASYAPTNFDPTRGVYPDNDSLETDLTLLYDTGFRGIITYGTENALENIPYLARGIGFDGIIMGVWLPNALQMGNGISQSEYVDGYCLGNENLERSYSLEELASAIEELREETGKPVTTTEEWGDYLGPLAEGLIAMGDWVFPNAHPYWAGLTNPAEASSWTIDRYNGLRGLIPSGKILFFKEVGLPSAGEPDVSEENQRDYYRLLGDSAILFSYFEAFDQPWKDWAPVEPHWGLFYADRSPKAVAMELLDDAD